MTCSSKSWNRGWVVLCGLFLLSAGCSGGTKEKRIEVGGKVLLGGQAMNLGSVTFHPDASKGNTATGTGKGMIQPDGTYKLVFDAKKPGMPLGWYKVTVDPRGMPKEMPQPGQPLPEPATINPRYMDAAKTNLEVEVKEDAPADHYDLKLVQ